MAIRRKMIQKIVDGILEDAGVNQPPVPVEKIAKANSLKLQKTEVTGSDISGFIFRSGGRAVIGINSANADVRQRFTIAHELGHYFIHSQGTDEVHIDRGFGIRFRDERSSQGVDIEEQEANFFAAELLMPRQFIKHDLEKVKQIDLEQSEMLTRLSKTYEVSSQALLFRLANLGYIKL